jgi:hypothetical protein
MRLVPASLPRFRVVLTDGSVASTDILFRGRIQLR